MALEKLTNSKITAAMPVRAAEKQEPAQYIRYTPSQQGSTYNSGAKQRIIRMVEVQKDPMEPARFKINKKIPRGPPSPPAPVMHSPTRKVTVKEQKDWKIPPCISNWKNAKGYTIPLDKRLSADGRNLQDVAVNDKFAALSEDLYLAERKAREEIKIRNDMIRQKRVREEEVREQQLRSLAAQAREQRAQLASNPAVQGETAREAQERTDRMRVLNDRAREIERDKRLEDAGKTNKKSRDEDRDVSERIALGQSAQPTSHEAIYDARLFNQSAGLDSGYHGGADEKVNVYDKPLFADRSAAGIYKFDKERMEQAEGRLGHIGTSSFAGAADADDGQPRSVLPRTAPVEFETEDDAAQRRPREEDRGRSRSRRGRGRSRSRRRDRNRDDQDEEEEEEGFGLDGLLEETKGKR